MVVKKSWAAAVRLRVIILIMVCQSSEQFRPAPDVHLHISPCIMVFLLFTPCLMLRAGHFVMSEHITQYSFIMQKQDAHPKTRPNPQSQSNLPSTSGHQPFHPYPVLTSPYNRSPRLSSNVYTHNSNLQQATISEL